MFPANNLDDFLIKYFEELNTQSWTLIPVELDFILKLQKSAQLKFESKKFKQASVTHSLKPQPTIRNDQIFWLDRNSDQINPSLNEVDLLAMHQLDNLVSALKNYFRISLTEYECHYAVYEAQHYYKKHIDATLENNKRIFSFVIFLNPQWITENGGQLVGYNQNQKIFEISPIAGQMVLFKSDLEHEVLKTLKTRYSLTGWIRK